MAQSTIDLTELHRLALDGGREELVGDIMMVQAIVHDRNGEAMSRDLYALEAAASYYEHGRNDLAQAALDLVGP